MLDEKKIRSITMMLNLHSVIKSSSGRIFRETEPLEFTLTLSFLL